MKIIKILLLSISVLMLQKSINAMELIEEQKTQSISEEHKKVLQRCIYPSDDKFKDFLDEFFADEDVKEYFFSPKKWIIYAEGCCVNCTAAAKLLNLNKPENCPLNEWRLRVKKEWNNRYNTYKNEQQEKHGCLLKKLKEKYKFSESLGHGTFCLKFDEFPSLQLLLPKVLYVDNNELIPGKFQNISRVFYNEKIRKFVEEEKLDKIYVPKKWLYHILGRPLELCDDNYSVVTESINELSESIEKNKKLFLQMVKEAVFVNNNQEQVKELGVKEEYGDLVTQFYQVVTHAGVWDPQAWNVFVLKNENGGKITFFDVEKPALGGGDDKYFFHKNRQQWLNNGYAGLSEAAEHLWK